MADTMEGVVSTAHEQPEAQNNDTKTVNDILSNFGLLERAVAEFDARFTLRALRSISSLRKRLSQTVLCQAIVSTYPPNNQTAKTLCQSTGVDDATLQTLMSEAEQKAREDNKHNTRDAKEVVPEIDIYVGILIQVYLYDNKHYQTGAEFSSRLVDRIRELNRRTLDSLAAKAYFYFALFHEALDPKPPSRQSPVISIRGKLLAALRSSVLRKDQDTQSAVLTLLLRNYISTADITQADLLVAQTQFPTTAPNNQVARYLYYLGRIRAVQLSYTEAQAHLTSATRKAPSSAVAAGFYQSSTKFLVVVELLMGDIPDRALFSQPRLERALEPYFRLVQAVRVGDLHAFQQVVQSHSKAFHQDGTYTLVLRLRQNVIKTGIRMLSLSYSRISLRDICIRLGLDTEESAEYIVAKAIRDGVIEATIDSEKGYMETKKAGDVYATREPAEAFHERIRACLTIHDECVKAMRYPMNQHRLELKHAQEARERERELAKEIQDGDIDEDDAAGDFEGLIDVSVRLRRAILRNDLPLVKRIVRNDPQYLQNPDFSDQSNTSLHLAAQHGFIEIAEYLILSSHETPSISLNTTNSTPLLLSITSSTPNTLALAKLLMTHYPSSISLPNNHGQTPLMLASKHGLLPLLPLLLTHPTHAADPNTADNEGNTALHYASAAGELKALRVLLTYGADPGLRNVYAWLPVAYSATVAAEQYFVTLVKEVEQMRLDAVAAQQQQVRRERERQGKRAGAVRLVTERDEGGTNGERGGGAGGGIRSADGSVPGYVDWSPVEERRRAMTPTAGRSEWSGDLEGRARAWSGE